MQNSKDDLLHYLRGVLVMTSSRPSYPAGRFTDAYRRTLITARAQNPELTAYLASALPEVYRTARQQGIKPGSLPVGGKYPPEACPWTLEQLLDEQYDFYQWTKINGRHLYFSVGNL